MLHVVDREQRGSFHVTYVALLAIMLALPLTTRAQSAWSPEKPVEIVIPSGPASGTDLIGRKIQNILTGRSLVKGSVIPLNKAGGGGALGLNYLNQHAGAGHLLYVTSPTLITSYLTGTATVNYTDVTPLALLFNEYVMIAAPPNSKVRNARELMEILLRDPGSLTIGTGTATGNANHIAIGAAYKAMGGDPKKLKIVIFKSGGEILTAAMGGHVDVSVTGAVSVLPHLQTGKLIGLAITAPKRLSGALAKVPTLVEQGVNAVSGQWRGMVGPRGMTEPQVTYWDQVFAKLSVAPEWMKELEANVWEPTYLSSADTRKFFDSENQELRAVLTSFGLIK